MRNSSRSPGDRPASPLAQWWNGILFVAKQFITFKGLLFSFPMILLGILLISGAEYFYLRHPGILPHCCDPSPWDDGSILLLPGLIFLLVALAIWRSTGENIIETSSAIYSIKKIDSYALLGLSGISAIFILLSTLFANPKAWNCALFSLIVAIVSAVVSLLRRSEV